MHVIFEPVDLIAKLTALVFRPRVNLTRYHGVFAPNSKHRALVTPARRGKGNRRNNTQAEKEKDSTSPHVAMSWALCPSMLKRLDLVSGQTTTVNVPGYKQALFTSDDGMRVVFMFDGELVVYRHDTGTLLHTSQALNFCTDVDSASGCEFESHRYVLTEPGTISGDGKSVLLQTIPERADVSEPQNIMELKLLDVDTGLLRRVVPDRDVLWIAISYAGDTIAYMDELGDDGTYLSEERLMVILR